MIEAFIVISFFLLLILLLLVLLVTSVRYGIPPTPSSKAARRKIHQLIKEHNPSGAILELGSGFGTLALQTGKTFSRATVTGIEISFIPFVVSKLLHLFPGAKNVRFIYGDLFSYDLAGADIIVCYLYRDAMRRLEEKIRNEARPGTIVISNTFGMPGFQPDRVIHMLDTFNTKLYLYRLQTATAQNH